MRTTSVARAKAHFSELIARAEHKGERTLILRHGKPAAMVVPAPVEKTRRRRRAGAELDALLDEMIESAPKTSMSIDEALGRNRLDERR